MSQLSSLPSFDSGGRVVRDMIAKVHQDEEVLNPRDAAAWRSGRGGFVHNGDILIGSGNAVTRTDVAQAFHAFADELFAGMRNPSPTGAIR